jgi:hypothetical protein
MKLKEKLENFVIDKFYSSPFMLLFAIAFTFVTLALSIGWVIEKIYDLFSWILKLIASPFIYIFNKAVEAKWVINVFDSVYFIKFLYILLRALVFVIANIASRYLLSNYWNEWWFNVVFSVLLVTYFYPEKEKDEDA